ncbi:alpha-glycosidase [Flavimobilis marinus]|uniref:Alpha-glucosidase n=1 Tax=Flavimobilis marinus TaxID=285351 RepID=A0A1I2FWG3_9MICO|nr:glycoside hydrolase family 13 protein [Flavimobilis marinus]GHG51078.1 alpha-glycosidase [Flavimobilis marinus]SFF09030.1 alpha-glucosidase [Flavimobilis marinus]
MTSYERGAGAFELPHHDGSALYVPQQRPGLGDTVTVRLRVPLDYPEAAVHVRMVRDGEPRMAAARLAQTDSDARWYEADVLVHNPVTRYRFMLVDPDGYAWLNARGLIRRGVTDEYDFQLTTAPRAPRWLRDAVVYQIFPDRFARSGRRHGATPDWAIPAEWDDEPIPAGPGVGQQFYGGDLDGVVDRLDHVADLGVTTVYLTPIFPGRSNHRYDASTFDHVDPLLGGDDALARLRGALSARGMRLVGDITTNHTGAGHEWFARARADENAPERDFYYWTQEEPGYVGWLEHSSLPKLDYRSPELARRMIEGAGSVVGRWLQPPFSLDGWRVDVANMTGRYGEIDDTAAVARTVRETIEDINPDGILISEHFHDARADLTGEGWHGNMNYSAFTRPLWSWLADPASGLSLLGLPAGTPRASGAAMVEQMRDFDAATPWPVLLNHWNMLCSHDTPRIRTVVGDPALVEVAAGLLLTYLGVPAIFAGDELGLTGTTGEHARVPMPWDRPERRDERTHEAYRSLIALRHAHPALREGSLRWVLIEDDAVGYLRETADETLLVVVARRPWAGTVLPARWSAAPQTIYGAHDLTEADEGWAVHGDGPAVGVWRLR